MITDHVGSQCDLNGRGCFVYRLALYQLLCFTWEILPLAAMLNPVHAPGLGGFAL
jgi:hypothetical protein